MSDFDRYKQHKILILEGTEMQNEYVDAAKLYIKTNPFLSMLKRLHEHVPIPCKDIWYGNWKQNINKYDVVIIFDGIRGGDVINYIHKANPLARIIVYYVNKFRPGAKNDPANFARFPCELWSFDKNDCQKLSMSFNPFCYDYIFFDEENREAYNDDDYSGRILYDAFFIGVDKNRLETLVKLKTLLEKYQYKTKIILKKAKHFTYRNTTDAEKAILTDQETKYKDVIKFIHQSKSIIEIVDNDQNGLTLRAMESLFFKRKLITNNLDILNYDFYKKENIFLLGQDDEERLSTFLSSQYEPVDDDIIKNYTWEEWLNRFFDDQTRGQGLVWSPVSRCNN